MDQKTRHELAREHLPLIDEIIAVMKKRFGAHLDENELRSFAMEGMAEALNRFDPSRGVNFRTFANPRIRGAVYDGLSKAGWFPRRLHRQIAFFKRSEELLHYREDDPAPKDKVEAVHRLADSLKELATAYVTTYAATEEKNEPASEPADAEQQLDRQRYRQRLSESINRLPGRQSEIMRYYFYEDMSLREISNRIGLDRSWISRLLSSGLATLRKRFDRDSMPLDVFEPPDG